MISVPLNNEDLIDILDTFMTALQSVDRSVFPYHRPKDFDAERACGEEYLKHMQSKPVDGYPEQTCGIDLMKYTSPYASLQKALTKLDFDLMNWSGSRNNAVKMLYPKGGFMGWHHNANAPGYNILLSWSKDGLGYFRYQDPITKEIVTMQDTPGWTAKVGYYGPFHEKDRIVWHCANADQEERFTLGYIIPHQGMWEDMTADIAQQ